jgi:hypothetical protein
VLIYTISPTMSRPQHAFFAIIALLFTFRQSCLSQVPPHIYIPFSVESAEWLVLQYDTQGLPSGTHTYLIQGDTLVSSQACKKVWFDSLYFGAVYDDSIGRKVYVQHKDSLSFSLLYDFNLTEGNWTVSTHDYMFYELTHTPPGYDYFDLYEVGYRMISGRCRNVKTLLYNNEEWNVPIGWIEGVGAYCTFNSSGHFVAGVGPFLPFSQVDMLATLSMPVLRTTTLKYRCCGYPWDTLWDGAVIPCDPVLGVHASHSVNPSDNFQFSPQPLTDISYLKSGSQTASGGHLLVSDPQGREVLNFSFRAGDPVQIQRSQLPTCGLYLFQYTSAQAMPVRGKILVQDQ